MHPGSQTQFLHSAAFAPQFAAPRHGGCNAGVDKGSNLFSAFYRKKCSEFLELAPGAMQFSSQFCPKWEDCTTFDPISKFHALKALPDAVHYLRFFNRNPIGDLDNEVGSASAALVKWKNG